MALASYDDPYYQRVENSAANSADVVVALAMSVVSPSCVVDVGCGTGTWLRAFLDRGADGIGIDGDKVDISKLVIAEDQFEVHDLELPFTMDQRFDLAVSLEVGEHLPDSSAETFVKSLTSLSDIVLFSAAIPGQRGSGHVNEQWPSYWHAHFSKLGYVGIDMIRDVIWNDSNVADYYAQNILFFVRQDVLSNYPAIEKRHQAGSRLIDVVHPSIFTRTVAEADRAKVLERELAKANAFEHLTLSRLIKLLPKILTKSLRHWFGSKKSSN